MPVIRRRITGKCDLGHTGQRKAAQESEKPMPGFSLATNRAHEAQEPHWQVVTVHYVPGLESTKNRQQLAKLKQKGIKTYVCKLFAVSEFDCRI